MTHHFVDVPPSPEQRLLIQNTDSGEQKECRVVYVGEGADVSDKGCSGIQTTRTELSAHRVITT